MESGLAQTHGLCIGSRSTRLLLQLSALTLRLYAWPISAQVQEQRVRYYCSGRGRASVLATSARSTCCRLPTAPFGMLICQHPSFLSCETLWIFLSPFLTEVVLNLLREREPGLGEYSRWSPAPRRNRYHPASESVDPPTPRRE